MAHSPSAARPRIAVLIPAAGSGERVGGAANKVLLPLAGLPLIHHTVRAFQQEERIERILLIARPEDFSRLEQAFEERRRWSRLVGWVDGGENRQRSVFRGVTALAEQPPDWVIVHDGARPLVSGGLVGRIIEELAHHPAVVPTLPIHDTVRDLADGSHRGIDRRELVRVQTPQGFHWKVLQEAHRLAVEQGVERSDDAQLVDVAGGSVTFIPGERRNLKLTTPPDFELAEWLLLNPSWGTAPLRPLET